VVRRASRRNPRPGAAFVFIELLLRPLLAVFVKRDWHGRRNVPREGGVIVVANHITYFDPISVAHFLVRSGRTPRFLAKSGLFKNPTFGKFLRAAGQIPVYRESRDAMLAVRDAIKAVERGETIIVYPEGTMTKDPNLWPMAAKTGAARIALRTGAPVLPIAQWGAQNLLAPYAKKPEIFPRKTLTVVAGEPVDLRAKFGKEINGDSLRQATEYLMSVITGMLAEIRGEQPPAEIFDPEAERNAKRFQVTPARADSDTAQSTDSAQSVDSAQPAESAQTLGSTQSRNSAQLADAAAAIDGEQPAQSPASTPAPTPAPAPTPTPASAEPGAQA
jgi:1-acyl-sn-glycerol-3-phosphate acyltransferase